MSTALTVVLLVAVAAPTAPKAAAPKAPEVGAASTLSGWTGSNRSEVSFFRPSALPGGEGESPAPYLRFVDKFGGYATILAPASFHGDWSALGPDAALSWQHRIFATGPAVAFAPFTLRLAGPGGAALWTGPTPQGVKGWVDVNAPLASDRWSLLSGSWDGLLTNVSSVELSIEQVNNTGNLGSEVAGIRSIVLIPAPASAAVLGLLALRLARRRR